MPALRPAPAREHIEMDPLLAATINKFPAAGPWPASEREAFFTLLRNVCDVVYGPVEREHSTGETKALMLAAPPPATAHYHIAPDGFAMADHEAIDPHNIPPGTVVHDYRAQPVNEELDPVMWKTHGAKAGWKLPQGVVIRAAEGVPPVIGRATP